MLGTFDPVARRLPRFGVDIDKGEVWMRRKLPRPRDEARGCPALSLGSKNSPGDLGSRHERRRKPQRLARESERLVWIGDLPLTRLGSQKHGAAAHRDVWLDMAVLPGNGERVERAFEVAGACLQIEQSIDTPGELRIALHRLLCERL